MGAALASPLLAEHPLEASAFVLGSVLPDVDALSRLGGRRAFLACHQGPTHALPWIALGGLLGAATLAAAGSPFTHLPLVIAAGMALHVLLDLSNTYGVMALAPFTGRRYALEWLFFVDAGALLLTGASLALAGRFLAVGEAVPARVGVGTGVAFLAYWAARAGLRTLAARRAPPGTLALVPSALWPWRYYGCRPVPAGVETFELDLLRGLGTRVEVLTHDAAFAELLESLPEFQVMRGLSPAFHAVEVARVSGGARITCKDLRTRNFGGEFGTLEVLLEGGVVRERIFHV